MPTQRAADLVNRYVAMLVEHQPTEASALGEHSRDGDLPDLTADGVEGFRRAVASLKSDVDSALEDPEFQGDGAAREARGDLQLLRDDLRARQFWLEDRPSLEQDPMAAVGVASSAVHELLRRTDLPDERQRGLIEGAIERARKLPALFEQAGGLLESTPEPHLQVALQRCAGLRSLLEEELPRRAAAFGLEATAAEAGHAAMTGAEAYAALVDGLRDRRSDWRLGPRDHAVALESALGTTLGADEIAARADTALTEARLELAEIARAHWDEIVGAGVTRPDDADATVVALLAAVASRSVVPRTDLASEAARAVDDARSFALDSGLTDVPPANMLTVTEVPPYLQGVAVAFISPAPPLEPDAGCTYYLSPVPEHWDDQSATAFLREYNAAALRSLAVHEAYPGHFVQLTHAGQHPRLARRLLRSSAFAEGWAVYIERLAAQRGFGGVLYRITQLKMALRVAANALLDTSMHSGEMTDAEAASLLRQRGFQEELEVTGKVARAKVMAGQLSSYFVGGVEMAALRDTEEKRHGGEFDEVVFHHRVLSHGTPTTKILAEALADPSSDVRRPFA